MNPNIGLSQAQRAGVSEILNQVLADEFVLYVKTLNYHWNVVGKDFYELHEFFGKLYAELAGVLDNVAERIRAMDELVPATVHEFLKKTSLKETQGKIPEASDMIGNLVRDHESLICTLRQGVDACAEKFHDAGTADFLTGLMEQHEKTAWMLRSFLAK